MCGYCRHNVSSNLNKNADKVIYSAQKLDKTCQWMIGTAPPLSLVEQKTKAGPIQINCAWCEMKNVTIQKNRQGFIFSFFFATVVAALAV